MFGISLVKREQDAIKPSIHSIRHRQDINDYVMGLFEKYDYVVLCERHHQDMTQYDMIYDLVTDSRFVDNVGVVFKEIETDGWCAGSLGRRIHIPLYPD